MVLEPSFVVLDEPTSALDMLFQAQMVDLLRDLQRKNDLTYVFISHDLRVVASLASHLIVMRHGKVVEEGAGRGAVQESEERLHARAVCGRVPDGDGAGGERGAVAANRVASDAARAHRYHTMNAGSIGASNSRRTLTISVPEARMRSCASAIGSIATAM